ncbi:hypothetical protein I3842_02G052400 [Carya illinoinensis]|uniref:Uncharacterized protein n=1 Tax=Carya illinoinensis TaxID=32201 RepID=A0A922FP39_CARIL|nr:hypothetical protein I3842_02G052400 [Carya illinoinensis]
MLLKLITGKWLVLSFREIRSRSVGNPQSMDLMIPKNHHGWRCHSTGRLLAFCKIVKKNGWMIFECPK